MKFLLLIFCCLALHGKNVLFIGNSYTANTRPHLQKIAIIEDWKVEFICPGGRKLTQHLNNKAVHDKIKATKWDYIFLQEQSQTPAYGNLRINYFNALAGFKKKFPQQNFVLFTTWGRRDGDKLNKKVAPTYLSMQKLLNQAFDEASKKFQMTKTLTSYNWQKVYHQNPLLFTSFYANDGSHLSSKAGHFNALWSYNIISGKNISMCKYKGPLLKSELAFIYTLKP